MFHGVFGDPNKNLDWMLVIYNFLFSEDYSKFLVTQFTAFDESLNFFLFTELERHTKWVAGEGV